VWSPEGVREGAPEGGDGNSGNGIALLIEGSPGPIALSAEGDGYFSAKIAGAGAGTRYRYRLAGIGDLPDPASRFQPEGVHGPSQVVDPWAYEWRHERPGGSSPEQGPPRSVIYELHVGTFTPAGTFRAAAEKLPFLAELGIDVVELMPVGDFPGRWNWGYDPGALFAPARAYGTPDDLRFLVDEAHGLGLRVLLDVVYNHFGPDGAYLPAFAPAALTGRHSTPWGQAVNYDGAHSHGVRRYCLENALMWLREYRLDGLRLDATFAIIDDSPTHLLAELAGAAAQLPTPRRLLVAEDPRNQRNVVLPLEMGGLGMGAVWADDFHHQVRVRLAGDRQSYFGDFEGSSLDIARTLQANWFYRGHHSRNGGAPRGTPAADLPADRFVYCIQNHDQVGNRPQGSRLNHDVPLHAYRAASALLLFAPQLPLLFMGQEWAAGSPFQFFTDHSGDLGRQVSEGRRREFAEFVTEHEVPDPQDPATFERSRLDWDELEREPHAGILRMYRDLLALRRTLDGHLEVSEVTAGGLTLCRGGRLLLLAFDPATRLALPPGGRLVWSSEDRSYAGDPMPPSETAGALTFGRAGAVVVEAPA
jgi:maltooligosyltrehalose trehalohydrolase